MPATLSPELIEGLLRGKLGFNGMVLTDASHGWTDLLYEAQRDASTRLQPVSICSFFQ